MRADLAFRKRRRNLLGWCRWRSGGTEPLPCKRRLNVRGRAQLPQVFPECPVLGAHLPDVKTDPERETEQNPQLLRADDQMSSAEPPAMAWITPET